MCKPPQEKIDWEAELPAGLIPPPVDVLDAAMLPLLEMVPFVSVQHLGELNESSDSMDAQSAASTPLHSDDDEVELESESDSTLDEGGNQDSGIVEELGTDNDGPVLISSCLNDPRVVWPSDTDSDMDSDGSDDGASPSPPSVTTDSDVMLISSGDAQMNSFYSVPEGNSAVLGRGRGNRGRNMARRSRPFFGKDT
jgi:hypothetical protein